MCVVFGFVFFFFPNKGIGFVNSVVVYVLQTFEFMHIFVRYIHFIASSKNGTASSATSACLS